VRRLIVNDLVEHKLKPDIPIVFDLVTSGEATNIARDKDKMIGDPVWDEYLRETRRKPRHRA
jgi:hypothetical protein